MISNFFTFLIIFVFNIYTYKRHQTYLFSKKMFEKNQKNLKLNKK